MLHPSVLRVIFAKYFFKIFKLHAGFSRSRINSKNIINISKHGHAEGISTNKIESSNLNYENWKENNFSCLSGEGGHLEGCDNWVQGNYSHAEGKHNAALGLGSHSQGQNTIAEGNYSFSSGDSTIAQGNYSSAFGKGSVAATDYSFVAGEGVISQGKGQIVFGNYNEITNLDNDSLLVIGNGTSDDKRNTILRVTKEGMLQASSFATLDGSPIGGGAGEDLPVGTIIINQNPNKSGFEQGDWKKLGKKVIELLDDDNNTITYTTYYWQRIEHWIIPSEDEKYIKDGVFTPDEEGYWVDDPRPELEEYYKDLIEIEGGNT